MPPSSTPLRNVQLSSRVIRQQQRLQRGPGRLLQPLPILHRHEDRGLGTSPGYYLWAFLEAGFEHLAETSLRILNRPTPHTKLQEEI
jgi:hypothetical protein